MGKKRIVLASGNAHKIKEIGQMLCDYEVVGYKDLGFDFEIEEDGIYEEGTEIDCIACTVIWFIGDNIEFLLHTAINVVIHETACYKIDKIHLRSIRNRESLCRHYYRRKHRQNQYRNFVELLHIVFSFKGYFSFF